MEVIVYNNFEAALKAFVRRCTPIIRELKDRRGYLKPSEKKKLKSMRARKKLAIYLKKMERREGR